MKNLVLFCALFPAAMLPAQQTVNEQLYARGAELLKARSDDQAFPIFQLLLKSDSTNLNYLQYTAYLYSRIGLHQAGVAAQRRYYRTGEYLAKKAIAIDDKSPDAHFAYVLALGRLTEGVSNRQKLQYAKVIKKEAERVIELNPTHVGAWHILGRWHREVSNIGAFEKAMINSFYGGMPPGASYEKAVECFKTCVRSEADHILHRYELAKTYLEMGSSENCRIHLEAAITIKPVTADDRDIYKKCEELLKSLD